MKRVVLLPVKSPGHAKSRLGEVLDPAARERLARGLARRATGAVRDARLVDEFLVISRDERVLAEAVAAGAVAVDEGQLAEEEDAARALNAALELGRRVAVERGADRLVVLMADLPAVEGREVDALFEALEDAGVSVVLAPDQDGRGLGALGLRPVDALGFEFGGGRALERHLASARARSLATVHLRLPGLAFDLDTSADLAAVGSLAPFGVGAP